MFSVRACAALLAALVVLCPTWAQERITQADLLRRVIDVQRLTTPPRGERTALYTSKQGRKGESDWQVLVDLRGPGAVTRMWFASPTGEIRVVIDGRAVLAARLTTVLGGELPPIEPPLVADNGTCCFPLSFNQSCTVERRGGDTDWQINTVQFAEGTVVQSFQRDLDDEARAALTEVQRGLRDGLTDKQLCAGQRLLPVALEQELGSSDVLSQTLDNAGTVRALYVALTGRNNPELYALHHCVLRVFVDGLKNPTVEAPLCDFFGAGFDLADVHGLVLGTDATLPIPLPERRSGEARFMYCLLPMPYREGLRVEIENFNEARQKIGLFLYLRVDTRPPAQDALCLHARFRRENPVREGEYVVLTADGPGRFVGCVLNVDGPRTDLWGAGADKLWLDGAKAAAYVGTDMAAFFGQRAPLTPGGGALHGVSRAGPYGKNSAYRWLLGDGVAFQKSIRGAFEVEQGQRDTYYGSMAYWYAPAGGRSFFKPLKATDLAVPALRIPGAVEIEDNIRGQDWGSVVKQKFVEGFELSGREAAHITTDQPVELNIPSATERTVRVRLRVNPRRSFDVLTVKNASGSIISTMTYDPNSDGLYSVGTIHLSQGDNWVTVQCGRPVTLDCWVLEDASSP
jgi:hypothetical protein